MLLNSLFSNQYFYNRAFVFVLEVDSCICIYSSTHANSVSHLTFICFYGRIMHDVISQLFNVVLSACLLAPV